jgi:hypothetical protein
MLADNETRYEVLKEYKTDKNVDRIKFVYDETGEMFGMAACYELDKVTKQKNGSLIKHKIKLEEGKFDIEEIDKIEVPYGVLDYKYVNKYEKIPEDLIFSANSNCSYSIFKNTPKLEEIKSIIIPSTDPDCTCNTLDTYNISNNSTLLLAMNDGFHHIYDINTSQSLTSIKSHEYGLWSILHLDSFNYLTGSEDSLLKLWDSRSNTSKAVGVNKHHTASVNCIQKDILISKNENVIITGSYDENFTVIDIRNFDKVLHRQKLDCAIWDMSQRTHQGQNIILMASIYEGFNIFEYEADFSLKSNLSIKFGDTSSNGYIMHNTIVYGVDTFTDKDDLYIASCSFYDNLVLYWKLSK